MNIQQAVSVITPETWAIVVQIASFILTLFVGVKGFVPTMNKVKVAIRARGLLMERWHMEVLAAALAVLYAILMGIVNGQLVAVSFSWSAFYMTTFAVLSLAKVQYLNWLRYNNDLSY